MRGLIYKDVCLFFKGLDKRIFLLIAAVMILLVVECGSIAGLLMSIMLAITVGIQHILVFSAEEKVEWQKYQCTMPVRSGAVITGKYAAVLVTLLVSVVGSVLFNLVIFAAYRRFSLPALGISAACAVAVPLCWTAVSLPAYYWFGFQAAHYMEIALFFPIFYTVKYFEESPDGFPLGLPIAGYVPLAAVCILVLFAVSYGVSLAGYLWHGRKKHILQ